MVVRKNFAHSSVLHLQPLKIGVLTVIYHEIKNDESQKAYKNFSALVTCKSKCKFAVVIAKSKAESSIKKRINEICVHRTLQQVATEGAVETP